MALRTGRAPSGAMSERLPPGTLESTKPIGYRADIQGLRAVAILPVLLFHAGVPGVGGGYVGVDVFFVISGFLITGIIERHMAEGRFSIVDFYERRIRRILPALIVVMTVVLAGSAWLFFPSDFKDIPRSIIAATLSCSNIFFWAKAGYFTATGQAQPMLHSWSLAVEEQFYLLFPLLLLLLQRAGLRWRKVALLCVAVLSFLLSLVLVPAHASSAFYLLPPRAWELMAGALLALGAVPRIGNTRARELVAAAGLAAIGTAVFSFDATTRFPGANALYPVLGAAALIHAAPGTAVGRLLGLAPVTAIGTISYSLYLVHWPVIVFIEYATDGALNGWDTIGAIMVSLLLATFSWTFVEAPFRSRTAIGQRALFGSAVAASLAVCAVAGAAMLSRGWPSRFSPEIVQLDRASDAVSPLRTRCHSTADDAARVSSPCLLGVHATTPSIALWGDSHGVELSYALGEILSRQGGTLAQQTLSSCAPILDVSVRAAPACAAHNRRVLRYITATPSIRTVVLVGFWADPANAATQGVALGLARTIGALRALGRKVVLVGPVPPAPFQVPRHLAHLAQAHRLAAAHGIARADLDRRTAYLASTTARLQRSGLIVFAPADVLCANGMCALAAGGRPLYFDSHHLSLDGARLVAARLAPLIIPSREPHAAV